MTRWSGLSGGSDTPHTRCVFTQACTAIPRRCASVKVDVDAMDAVNTACCGLTADTVWKDVRWGADSDPERWTKQGRQFSVMDASGNVATHTGSKASTWAGHRIDRFVSAQGNILAGPEVVESMVRAFNETRGHLSLRLMAALEAGQAAGGDTRGMQSAAMLIVKEDGGVWLNNDVVLRLQVDDAEDPIVELRRLVELAAQQRERIQAQRRGSGR